MILIEMLPALRPPDFGCHRVQRTLTELPNVDLIERRKLSCPDRVHSLRTHPARRRRLPPSHAGRFLSRSGRHRSLQTLLYRIQVWTGRLWLGGIFRSRMGHPEQTSWACSQASLYWPITSRPVICRRCCQNFCRTIGKARLRCSHWFGSFQVFSITSPEH